jgi:hypothetical protein
MFHAHSMTFFRRFVTLKAVAPCINCTRQALSFAAATVFVQRQKSTLTSSLPRTGTSAFEGWRSYPGFAAKHSSSYLTMPR